MHPHLILFVFILTIILISAKNIALIDDENHLNEERTEIFHLNRYMNQLDIFLEMLLKLLKNEENYQIPTVTKRAKAIIKGDPREFMG